MDDRHADDADHDAEEDDQTRRVAGPIAQHQQGANGDGGGQEAEAKYALIQKLI